MRRVRLIFSSCLVRLLAAMADPLTVVGVVASIVQLVDVSAKIITRVHQYAKTTNDVPMAFRSLATQLNLLGITLQYIQAQAENGQLGSTASHAIQPIVDSILDDIRYLERIIVPVKASSFDRSLQALKSLAWEDKMQQRIQRIQANIQLLGFHQSTLQLSMARNIVDIVKESRDSQVMLDGVEADAVLDQFRDLALGIKKSAFAVTSLQSHGGAVAESSLSVWLMKVSNRWADHHPRVKFLVTDWNADGVLDLVAIKKQQTGTGTTEVHILSGADDYQTPLLQVGTPIPETTDNYDFLLADWSGSTQTDVIAIKKNRTESNSTEIHVLNGDNNFQSFSLQVATPLEETADDATFLTTDWMQTGRADIVYIKRRQTGSNSTEVHILSALHNYSVFSLHTGTALPETDDSWHFVFTYEFTRHHRPDLAAIRKNGSDILEVCLLSGIDNFATFIYRSDRATQDKQWQTVASLLDIE